MGCTRRPFKTRKIQTGLGVRAVFYARAHWATRPTRRAPLSFFLLLFYI
jgi:hypothetical protein